MRRCNRRLHEPLIAWTSFLDWRTDIPPVRVRPCSTELACGEHAEPPKSVEVFLQDVEYIQVEACRKGVTWRANDIRSRHGCH